MAGSECSLRGIDMDGGASCGMRENLRESVVDRLRSASFKEVEEDDDGSSRLEDVFEETIPPVLAVSRRSLVAAMVSAYKAFSFSLRSFSFSCLLRSSSSASCSLCLASCSRWRRSCSSSLARLRRSSFKKWAFCSRFFFILTMCRGSPSSPSLSSSEKRTMRFTADFRPDFSGAGGDGVGGEFELRRGDGVEV